MIFIKHIHKVLSQCCETECCETEANDKAGTYLKRLSHRLLFLYSLLQHVHLLPQLVAVGGGAREKGEVDDMPRNTREICALL